MDGLVVYRRYEPAWLLLAVYASVFMVFAAIQVRFAAQFVVPLSVLGGVGVVYALSAIDLARRPTALRGADEQTVSADGERDAPSISLPDPRRAGYILGIGLLVCGLSLLYAPGLAAQTSYSDAQYDALVAIEDHAVEADREYPENFVLSEWGDSRMYNYFVNGESRGYGYAMSNYDEFRFGDDPDGHYDQFEDRVGYVVVTDVDADVPAESAQVRLLEGAGTGDAALEHYQLLYVDDDRSTAAYVVVPGATLEAAGEPGETVVVSTAVDGGGESFTYERSVTVGDDGRIAVTVPYTGEYSVGDERVTVSEDDVLNGHTVGLEDDGDSS